MLAEGIQHAVNSMLRDSYGNGALLKKAMEKAITESEPLITEAMKEAVAKAVVSPTFLQVVEKDIASSLANQYRGAFEAVIRSAAKNAANNEIVARRVVELTKQAAGIE